MAFRNSLQSGDIINNLNAIDKLPQTIRALNPKNPEDGGNQIRDVSTNMQGTNRQAPFKPSSETVNGVYTLNLPRPEEGKLAFDIFCDLMREIEEYQLDKRNVYFKEHYDMVIDAAKSNTIIDDAILRDNYRVYAQRFAERAAAYVMEKLNQIGAYLNIESTSRLLKGVWSSIATDLRLNYRNNFLNQFGSSPEPILNKKPVTKRMVDYMKMAVGRTAYNARIICIPLIDHTPWGNRYEHYIRPENMFATKADGTVVPLDPTNTQGFDDYFTLMRNVAKSANRINSDDPNEIEAMPYVENIGTIFATDSDSVSLRASVHANKRAFGVKGIAPNGSTLTYHNDNLTGTLWNNYFIIDRRLRIQYPEYFNANDDGVRWLIDHGYLAVCPSHSEIHSLMGSVFNTTITDLLQKMTYKKDNQVNTATIVEYMVKATDSDGRNDSTDDLIHENFEKFDLYTEDAARVIHKMKQYPGNAPRIFTNVEQQLVVVGNSVSDLLPKTVSKHTESGTEKDDFELHHVVYGETASLYDFGLIMGMDVMNAEYVFGGLTSDSVKSLIQYDSTPQGVVFKEHPDSLFVLEKPIIDTTDLTKCGFDIMLSKETQMHDEWYSYLTAKSHFGDQSNWNDGYPAYGVIAGAGTFTTDLCMVSQSTTKPGKRAHVAIPEYIDMMQHALVFVGAGILEHPALIHASTKAGFYSSRQNIPIWHDKGSASTFKFIKDIYDIQSQPSDETIKEIKDLLWFATDLDVKSDETDECSNLMLGGFFEQAIDDKQNYAKSVLFITDPSYGPVLIAIDGIGLADFNKFTLPMISNGNRNGKYDQSEGFTFHAGKFQLGGGSGLTIGEFLTLDDVSDWDIKDNNHIYDAISNIIPWLESFKIPIAQYDPEYRSLQFGLDGQLVHGLDGDTMWYLHMINKVQFNPADKEHLIGFRDSDGSEFTNQQTIQGLDKMTAAEDEMKKKVLANTQNPDNTSTEGGKDANGKQHKESNDKQGANQSINGTNRTHRRNHRNRRQSDGGSHKRYDHSSHERGYSDRQSNRKTDYQTAQEGKEFVDKDGRDRDKDGNGKDDDVRNPKRENSKVDYDPKSIDHQ